MSVPKLEDRGSRIEDRSLRSPSRYPRSSILDSRFLRLGEKLLLFFVFSSSLLAADSLYEQSLAPLLERRFPAAEISYLLLEAESGRVLASRWAEPGRPVPMGSLVKPFTAVAYGGAHAFRYPEFVCRGEASGCWLPKGHGRVGISEALAYSCNGYFRALAAGVSPEDVRHSAQRFGISGPPNSAPVTALIGLESGWKTAPLDMGRAYLELAARAAEPGALEVVRGMALSARAGTGRAIGQAALVKTGTAPCAHFPKARGDGYVVALYPAESPRFALLMSVHGVPGMRAAGVAGEILRAMLGEK